MSRKLRLQNPLVFEPSTPPLARRLIFLFIVGCAAALTHLAFTSLTGVLQIIIPIVIAILALLLCIIALDGIEGKVIVNADSIEWRSPIKKTKLLWNDNLQFQVRQTFTRGGVIKTYDVLSANETISFGENLRYLDYLRSIIDAGINGTADENNEVSVPLAPLDESKSEKINAMFMVAILAFIGSVILGLMLYVDAKPLYLIPTIPIHDVSQYADKYIDIKVKGRLIAEPPVVSRDDKHDFGYQYVRLNLPPDEGTGVIAPLEFYIMDGADKVAVKVSDYPPNYFGDSLRIPFKKGWQNTDIGKLTAKGVDEFFKKFDNTPPDESLEVSVLSIDQGLAVESIGHVKTQDGKFILTATEGTSNWLMPCPNKQLEKDFLIKAIMLGASLALGIYLMVACFFELKQTYL